MRPKKRSLEGSDDLFRARLDQIINMRHELVGLADRIDWDWIDDQVADRFSAEGRPATETGFIIGILLLKQTYGLSDEGVWERWVHDPYFQYFTGETLELLLAESLRVVHATGALKARDMERVTVDTTVQPKNVTHPTDAKMMHKAIVMLGALARKHGVRPRQSYIRVAKQAAVMASRYAHAKHWKRQRRRPKFLRTRLGRLIRDIRRKIEGDGALKQVFAGPLSRAAQVRSQQQRQRG